MRLGQLSRKLKVKPQEIVDFISETFKKTIEVHPNSKIEDEFIAQIEEYFKLEALPTEEPSEKYEDYNEDSTSQQKDIKISHIVQEKNIIEEEYKIEQEKSANDDLTETEETILNTNNPEEALPEEIIDEDDLNLVDGIIKAPKVDIEGIKVVGKIDLPEKVVPQKEDDQENDSSINQKDKTEKQRKQRERKRQTRRKKPEISLEEQERKEYEAYEKRKAELKEAEKRKKKKHYEKKIAQQKASSTKEKKKTKNSNKKDSQEDSVPTTLWGKFIKWLNT